jgi:hypothetical protein
MVRNIDGKKFDTATAIAIAAWENGLPHSDYYHVSETLYRTKNGVYFLAGSGGPLTKYAFECGGLKGYGSGIIPITADDALAWLIVKDYPIAIEKHSERLCPHLSIFVVGFPLSSPGLSFRVFELKFDDKCHKTFLMESKSDAVPADGKCCHCQHP